MNAGKSPPTRPAALRAWAAERLEVTADATPEQARRAFLAQLAEHDFVPYEGRFEAAQALGGGSNDSAPDESRDFEIHFERLLVAAVEEFAAEYFELPPTVRQQRWEDLTAKCAASRLAMARLDALEPGLSVPQPAESGDAFHDAILRSTCKLFILDPLRRPALERKFWARAASDAAQWEMAGRRFFKTNRQLAELLPKFFKRLISLRKQIEEDAVSGKERAKKVPKKKTSANAKAQRGVPWWLIMVGLFAGRMLFSPTSHHSSTPSPKITNMITKRVAIELFEMSDEQLATDNRRGLITSLNLETRRDEYRASLRRVLGSRPPEIDKSEADDKSAEATLTRRLAMLDFFLKLAMLRDSCLDGTGHGQEDSGPVDTTSWEIRREIAKTQAALDRLSSGGPGESLEEFPAPAPSSESFP